MHNSIYETSNDQRPENTSNDISSHSPTLTLRATSYSHLCYYEDQRVISSEFVDYNHKLPGIIAVVRNLRLNHT